jgi:hypothetical protein
VATAYPGARLSMGPGLGASAPDRLQGRSSPTKRRRMARGSRRVFARGGRAEARR